MSSRSAQRLWSPLAGIKFAPKGERVEKGGLYPDLSKMKGARSMSTGDIEKVAVPKKDEVIVGHGFSEITSLETALNDPKPTDQKTQDASKAEEPTPPAPASEPTLPSFLESGELPETSLPFKLSKIRYELAQKCKENTPGSYWSHKMYNRPNENGSLQEVKVHYCTQSDACEKVLKEHFADEKVIGFDMEWASWASKKHGPRENTSLIQIASPSNILLLHIALFRGKTKTNEDFIAPTFRTLMEDENVMKAGVNILGDMTRLKNTMGITAVGVIELSHLYKLVLYSKAEMTDMINKNVVRMEKQVKEVLGLPVYKGDVRTSDWMKPLTKSQIDYAASDAYAGLQLFHVLEGHREKLDPCPPRPHFAELKLPIEYVVKKEQVEEEPEIDSEDEGSSVDSYFEEPSLRELTEAEVNALAEKGLGAAKLDMQPEEDFFDDILDDLDEAELNALHIGAAIPAVSPRATPPNPRPSSTVATSSDAKQPPPPRQHRDERIQAADQALQQHPKRIPQARPHSLRAYYAWHLNVDLPPDKVAALLRDPPLATNTVVGYIADAITTENLPYSKDRMSSEVLSFCHSSVLKGRYSKLAEDCNYERNAG